MNTALALKLDQGKPEIIPVFLEDERCPTALADFRAVSLLRDQLESGYHDLIAGIRGEASGGSSLVARFRRHLLSFAEVSDELAEKLKLQYTINQTDFGKDDERSRQILANGRHILVRDLRANGCAAELQERILSDFDQGRPSHVIGFLERKKALDWLRGTTDKVLILAAELWNLRSKAGVTLNWINTFLQRHEPTLRGKL